MNALETYLTALAPGMDIIAACRGLSGSELMECGAPDAIAADLLLLCESYYGRTAFSRMQRRAIADAHTNAHSIALLAGIERVVNRAPSKKQAWELRAECCAMSAEMSTIIKHARRRVREMKKSTVSPGVRTYRRPNDYWTLAITGTSSFIADLQGAITATDKKPLQAVEDIFFGAGSAARSTVVTNAVVPLEKFIRIRDGHGDDVQLDLTNGATMSGTEYLRRVLNDAGYSAPGPSPTSSGSGHSDGDRNSSGNGDGETGYVTLVHPVEGPVNLYRTARVATDKQRMMAAAENPRCAWPGCNQPADLSQVHHLTAWSRGGETNMKNLVVCCAYHNGINDDDPNAPPRRGRLERVGGRIVWRPPVTPRN